MGWRKYLTVASSTALLGVAVVVDGCSSSSGSAGSGGPTDAAAENVIIQHKDSGSSSGSSSSGGGGDDSGEAGVASFDGTTGQKCTKDSDCNAKAGVNVCSIDYDYTVTGVKVQLWPTPICMPKPSSTGNCDPCGGTTCSANHVYGCDSADLDPTTSPGLCLPLNSTAPVADQGACIPRCELALDGSAPVGCAGIDTCVAYTYLLQTNGTIQGIGFCQGSCQTNGDCSALGTNFVCQTDIGFCTQAAAPVARTLAIGAACTGGSAATSDSTLGHCNCEYDTQKTGDPGYCTSSCVIGGTACPDGYICDGFFPEGPLNFGNDASEPSITKQNVGAVGTCIAPCTLADGGTTSDAGTAVEGGTSACPTNSSCLDETFAGPDCLP